MKNKILIVSLIVAGVLVLCGVGGGAYYYFCMGGKSQVINFDNGDKMTLLGVDYGKKHVLPGTKPGAASTAAATAARRQQGGSSFTTPNDTLVMWVRLEHDPNQYPNYQYFIYDKKGLACTEGNRNYFNNRGGQQSNEVMAIQFQAFPRRGGKLDVRVQGYLQNVGQVFAEKKFNIANPAGKSFTDWKPESLPATREDDGLSVTLTKLSAGSDSSYSRDRDNPDDAVNKAAQAVYHVEFGGNSVTNWEPVAVTTSDATGNSIYGSPNTQWQDKDATTTYQWGLWPDEPAWKVRFEFSKKSGYDDNELWKVEKIPFEPGLRNDFWNYNNRRNTNTVFAERDMNGIHLKIFPAKQFTDVQANSNPQGGLTIEANPTLPTGMHMDITMTDDQGQDVQNYNSGTMGNGKITTYRYQLNEISGATNLNLSIAVHKSRFVEFTARPEAAAAK